MLNFHRPHWLTFLYLALDTLTFFALGALQARQAFLTRGMPDGLPQPIAHGRARLGINVNLEQYDTVALAANLERIEATGITYLKQSFYYQEPFDWSASDRLFTAVAQHNLILVPLLNGHPDNQFAPPSDPLLFATWAGEFANRYGQQATYYIIWDEPNLASQWGGGVVNPTGYAALLTAAAQAIRLADPDAVIIVAPLAPTIETGPENLSELLFLQALYDSGAGTAFDVVASKPYGFDSGPEDRRVEPKRLNFSRAILLREVMEQNGDGHKALWAGNWGWNSLPADWTGQPSIWGQTTEQTQAEWTMAALQRARLEWPWMGVMFLENWQPQASPDDPRWGFAVAGRAVEQAISSNPVDPKLAYPGFHPAHSDDAAQSYQGNWRFSPEFGADISQSGDSATFYFWGTDVGLRVRRADYRARLYISIDGQPPNALPRDERGRMLVLTSPDPVEDRLSLAWVAKDLAPGPHTLTLTADGGWDQWALNGFSVGYQPPRKGYRWAVMVLMVTAVLFSILAIRSGLRADWGEWSRSLSQTYGRLDDHRQLTLTAVTAALVALMGWLTWGEQAAGVYRRLGDSSQLTLTAATAAIFYVTPTFSIFLIALGLLFLLIYFRPAWGLALIAFCIPFYFPLPLNPLAPKPILHYHFSLVEIFTLVTLAAFIVSRFTSHVSSLRLRSGQGFTPHAPQPGKKTSPVIWPDWAVLVFTIVATISLFFTERLGVATTEWRVVILEPALFYLLIRAIHPTAKEMWVLLDAFVLGGLIVAGVGLWHYFGGGDGTALIEAEGGLVRLKSFYGSPNNVALYLGRILPILTAVALMGVGKRRVAYTAVLLPILLAMLLSFSKGALFLAMPLALLIVFAYWQRQAGRPVGRWLVAIMAVGGLGLLIAVNTPQLAGRLNPQGFTAFLRVNLWQSSLNMIADHPFFGVGLDNFLYAYRGRYIFDAAWQEPDLSHPHNIVLDFATRLGMVGLLAGGWLFWTFWRTAVKLPNRVNATWRPVAIGIMGALGYMLAHGLVDHSFFLVDLAFAFYLLLGIAAWLNSQVVDE